MFEDVSEKCEFCSSWYIYIAVPKFNIEYTDE